MQREITMEAVFQAGFKTAWNKFAEDYCECHKATSSAYFRERNEAWLEYVKELEAPDGTV